MSYEMTSEGQLAVGDISFMMGTSNMGDIYGWAPVEPDMPSYLSFNDYKEAIQSKTPVGQNNLLLKIDGFVNSEFASRDLLTTAYHELFGDIEENTVMAWGSLCDGGVGFANYDSSNLVFIINKGIKKNQNETVSPVIVYVTQPYMITITNNGAHRAEIASNVPETGTYENGFFVTRTWQMYRDQSMARSTREFRVFTGNIQCCQSYIEEDPITHIDAYLNVVFNAYALNAVEDYLNSYTSEMPATLPTDDLSYFKARSLQRKFYALSNLVFNYDTDPTIDNTTLFGGYSDDYSDSPYGPSSNSSGDGGYGKQTYWSEPCNDDGLPEDDILGTGLVDLYNPTKTELRNFSEFLFSGITDSMINVIKRMLSNPLDGVISAHMIHTKPPTSAIQSIKFCGFDSNCTANVVSNQFNEIIYTFTFDDSIILRYKSFLDNKQYARLKIFLPYSGYHELDIDEFINGGAITARYKLDYLSGNCYISVEAKTPQKRGNQLEGVVATFTGNFSNPMPLSSIDYRNFFASALGIGASAVAGNPVGVVSSALATRLNVDKSGDIATNYGFMGKQEPFILLEHPCPSIPVDYDKYKGYPSNVTTNLKGLKHFIKVQDGTMWATNIPCTDEEKEEIKTLFEGGVYIYD